MYLLKIICNLIILCNQDFIQNCPIFLNTDMEVQKVPIKLSTSYNNLVFNLTHFNYCFNMQTAKYFNTKYQHLRNNKWNTFWLFQ